MIARFPLFMVIAADQPAKTVKQVVEWAKAHPDKANYATTSPAFTITTELLKLKSGMPGIAIPYRSSTDMILSVVSGQTMTAIADGPPTVPMVKAGKVKAVAVTGAERSTDSPTSRAWPRPAIRTSTSSLQRHFCARGNTRRHRRQT